MRVPKYRVRPDRDTAFVEVEGRRVSLPGQANSAASKDAYRRLINEYLLRKQSQSPAEPLRPQWEITVGEVVLAYLDHCELYYGNAGHTRSNEYDNCRLCLRPLVALYGDLPACNLTPAEVKAMRDRLATGSWKSAAAKKPIQAWSRGHINVAVTKIKRMLRWGVEEGIVSPTVSALIGSIAPLKKGRSAAKESPPVEPVAAEVVADTLPYLPSVVAAMVELQQLTGMRSDNLCSLRPCDVDRSGEIWLYRPAKHKTGHRGRTLVIPIGPKGQVVLRPYLDRPADAYCFSPREVGKYTAKRDRKRIRGTRYITNTYRNAVRRAVKKANIERAKKNLPKLPYWHPHQLRHLRTEQVKRAGGLEAARAFLGHSSVRTTEIYDARDLDLARHIAREIG